MAWLASAGIALLGLSVVATAGGPAGSPVLCAEDTSAELLRAVDALEAAVLQLDEDVYDAWVPRVLAALPCVRRELGAAEATRVHRALGMLFWIEGDHEASASAWAAVKALEPSWTPPPGLMGVMFVLFEEAEPAPGGVRPQPRPWSWTVDGTREGRLPVGRGMLVHELGPDEEILQTVWVRDHAELRWRMLRPDSGRASEPQVRVLARGGLGLAGQRAAPTSDYHPDQGLASEQLGARVAFVAPLGPGSAHLDLSLERGPRGLLADGWAFGALRTGPVALGLGLHLGGVAYQEGHHLRRLWLPAPALFAALADDGPLHAELLVAASTALYRAEARGGLALGKGQVRPVAGLAVGWSSAHFTHPEPARLQTHGLALLAEVGLRLGPASHDPHDPRNP